jgi:hypothetical protein
MKVGLSFTLFPFAFRHGVSPSLGVSPLPPELGARSFCQTRPAALFPPIPKFKCYSQLPLISFATTVDVLYTMEDKPACAITCEFLCRSKPQDEPACMYPTGYLGARHFVRHAT